MDTPEENLDPLGLLHGDVQRKVRLMLYEIVGGPDVWSDLQRYYGQNITIYKIAEETGEAPSTVRKRIHRAVAALKRCEMLPPDWREKDRQQSKTFGRKRN